MERLSLILWRERELLDTLLYRLEIEQLVLATGRSRWLRQAAGDVEAVLSTIRETELLRSVAADEVAEALGMSSNPSLRALVEQAPEPWRDLLADHHRAFEELVGEVTALADANRDLITTGYRSARETLMSLDDGADGYTPAGSAVVDTVRARLVDRSL